MHSTPRERELLTMCLQQVFLRNSGKGKTHDLEGNVQNASVCYEIVGQQVTAWSQFKELENVAEKPKDAERSFGSPELELEACETSKQ